MEQLNKIRYASRLKRDSINQVIFEGVILTVSFDKINPGDSYIARRNTGWKLLTCKESKRGIVYPVDNYCMVYFLNNSFNFII